MNLEFTTEQQEVLKAIYEGGLSDGKSYIVNMPYGTGKTIIGLEAIEKTLAKYPAGLKKLAFYTSGGDGGSLRIHQAGILAKEHGYPILGSLGTKKLYFRKITKRDRVLLQKIKSGSSPSRDYAKPDKTSSVFLQVTDLRKVMQDSPKWADVELLVIDEIDEVARQDFEGYRGFSVKEQFQELFQKVKQFHIPVIGLTATGNDYMLDFLCHTLRVDKSTAVIGADYKSPYRYDSKIKLVNDAYVEKINTLLVEGIHLCTGKIAKLSGIEDASSLFKLIYMGLPKLFLKKPVDGVFTLDFYQDGVASPIKLRFREEKVEELKEIKRELNLYSSSRIILLNSTPDHLYNVLKKSYILKIRDVNEAWIAIEKFIGEAEENETVLMKGGRNALLKKLEDLMEKVTDRWLQIFMLSFLRAKRPYLQGKLLSTVYEALKKADNGQKVVLITRFVTMAKALQESLEKMSQQKVGCLTGQDSTKVREKVIEDFRYGTTNLLVLNKLGSKGLDLKTADCVMHVDIDSNKETMKQRRERIRGGEEVLVVYANTGEGQKIEDYVKLSENEQLIEQYQQLADEF
ncbi:MAG: DEAD/DEAH box helicase [Candidatus Odinarchaeota archaeon]